MREAVTCLQSQSGGNPTSRMIVSVESDAYTSTHRSKGQCNGEEVNVNDNNNLGCSFSASFDHRKILSALLTIFTLLSFHHVKKDKRNTIQAIRKYTDYMRVFICGDR